jgi:hypothetical protein
MYRISFENFIDTATENQPEIGQRHFSVLMAIFKSPAANGFNGSL